MNLAKTRMSLGCFRGAIGAGISLCAVKLLASIANPVQVDLTAILAN